jgi:hypothetical protein
MICGLTQESNMDRIEYWEDPETPDNTGWYINSYDDAKSMANKSPYDSVGPYDTKTEALRVWRDTTPHRKTDDPEKEPPYVGHED